MNFTLSGSLPPSAVNERFHGFNFHPELAFVVDGAAGVNILVALVGSKGGVTHSLSGSGAEHRNVPSRGQWACLAHGASRHKPADGSWWE